MRAHLTLAALLALACSGAAIRAQPLDPGRPSPDVAPPPGGRSFVIPTGDVQGWLIRWPGCADPIGVATVPGYVSGLDYAALDWSRGPAVTAFWFGSHRLSPEWARVVAAGSHALHIMGRSFGIPVPGPDATLITFVPKACHGGVEAALSDIVATRAQSPDR